MTLYSPFSSLSEDECRWQERQNTSSSFLSCLFKLFVYSLQQPHWPASEDGNAVCVCPDTGQTLAERKRWSKAAVR